MRGWRDDDDDELSDDAAVDSGNAAVPSGITQLSLWDNAAVVAAVK